MDNNEIKTLTKKWNANLVYYFEDFDNETHSQRLSAYIDQKPLDKIKEANLIELTKEHDRWKLTNKGIDLLESIKNIYRSGRIFLPPPTIPSLLHQLQVEVQHENRGRKNIRRTA